MNDIPQVQELVMFDGKQLVTDSLGMAKTFNKRHGNILRAYDGLECSDEFNRLNYESVEYVDVKGQLRRFVKMTKNGFVFLAMGFTGPRADAFKEAYIAAFDAMADHIASQAQTLWKQLQALMAKESESKVRASFGSHLMIKRKREIPHFNEQRALLFAQIQPSLFVS